MQKCGEQRVAGWESQEIGEGALFGFRVQHLVSPVIGGCATEKFFEELIKVTGVVKAYRDSQVGNRTEILFGVHQLFC